MSLSIFNSSDNSKFIPSSVKLQIRSIYLNAVVLESGALDFLPTVLTLFTTLWTYSIVIVISGDSDQANCAAGTYGLSLS
jgi:hypothetical protein